MHYCVISLAEQMNNNMRRMEAAMQDMKERHSVDLQRSEKELSVLKQEYELKIQVSLAQRFSARG